MAHGASCTALLGRVDGETNLAPCPGKVSRFAISKEKGPQKEDQVTSHRVTAVNLTLRRRELRSSWTSSEMKSQSSQATTFPVDRKSSDSRVGSFLVVYVSWHGNTSWRAAPVER